MFKYVNLTMELFRKVIAVLHKDLSIELRSRYAVNTVFAFVAASLLLLLFTLRAQELAPTPKSGLVWIIILFAALAVLSRSFVAETENKTYDLLRVYGNGNSVFLGKLIFNFSFTTLINLVTFTLYIFLVGLNIVHTGAFLIVLLFGSAGIASVSTLIAAVVAQADRKGVIFSVLSIPLLVPLLLIVTRVTKGAFIDGTLINLWSDVAALVGFTGVTVTAGLLLFEYIWEE